MPKAKVSDVDMYYEILGDGPPLLVTTGWAMVERTQSLYRDSLPKHYKCIFHEHRGIGRSDAPDSPYSIEMMADDLAGLLDHLEIDVCRLEGSGGMGGLVGLEFAIRHGDRISSAHLGSPCLTLDNFSRELMLIWKEMRKYDVDLWARDVTLWVYTPETFRTRPQLMKDAARIRAAEPTFPAPHAYDRIIEAYCSYDATDRAHTVSCPTLITTGDGQDLLSGPRFTEEVHKRIKGSELHVFKDTSHNYWVERKEEWEKVMLDFFARH